MSVAVIVAFGRLLIKKYFPRICQSGLDVVILQRRMVVVFPRVSSSAKVMAVLPVVIVAAWMATRREGPWTLIRILGLLLILFGLGLMTLARIQLEKESSRRAGLVTRGVYSRIRHPIYVFALVTFAGLLLYLDEPLGIPPLFLMGLLPLFLARREEHYLEALYGDQYRRYKQRTWF